MTRTTPPRPVDVEAFFPELAALRRDAVRLHPRAGDPGIRDSSVGGPLLWPEDEAWPRCDEGHLPVAFDTPESEPVPLVPVLQLYAADVPDLPYPAGSDVLQVLWCPFEHEPQYAPRPRLRWRSSAVDTPVLLDAPRPVGAPDDHVPDACVVHPERITEYPSWDLPPELSETLRERFDQLEGQTGWAYQHHLSVAGGIKTGGYPDWTQEADWPDCAGCDRRMEHLLTVGSVEFDGASWRSWLPEEDRPKEGTVLDLPFEERMAVQCAPGLMLGDMGGIYIFECLHCPDRPSAYRFDCS
ncbi:DUF1963 domain-containing protein [Streptomyces sp. H27-C3]|uniref:DUF1963 domain-containing protein n=1 Tax=Streptomyces sp. H27-C3 TaxID=3046305 RepID=UPI0024BB1601|nr:DUF1963 domain-containing protein [Streptomyces sp. H27-C3]MDJ0461429.1 DUF1963 domain-containing protein [Streptomyces sp. H27-C3]